MNHRYSWTLSFRLNIRGPRSVSLILVGKQIAYLTKGAINRVEMGFLTSEKNPRSHKLETMAKMQRHWVQHQVQM